MKYLLDTNVFLWSLATEDKLNKRAAEILSSDASEIYLSAASVWEITIKFALGSLTLPSPPAEFVPRAISAMSIQHLEITHFHALSVGELSPLHRDPFDRMLAAQTRTEGMILLTADRIFQKYKVEWLYCGR